MPRRFVLLLFAAFLVALLFLLMRRAREPALVLPTGGIDELTLDSLMARDRPRDPQAHFVWGVNLLQHGRARSAVEKLQRACALEPNNARSAEMLGHACALAGAVDDALAAYKAAVALGQPNAPRLQALGERLGALEVRAQLGALSLEHLLELALPDIWMRAHAAAERFEALGTGSTVDDGAVARSLLVELTNDTLNTETSVARFLESDFLLGTYCPNAQRVHIFDEEYLVESYQKDYPTLVQELVTISQGALQGLRVDFVGGELFSQRGDGQGATLKLSIGGRSFEAKLRDLNDWVDTEGLLALLNQAVVSRGDRRRYYRLENPWAEDQSAYVLFGSEAQRDALLAGARRHRELQGAK